MKHQYWWCNILFNKHCAPCLVRQVRMCRGESMTQAGWTKQVWASDFTVAEKMWILSQVRIIE